MSHPLIVVDRTRPWKQCQGLGVASLLGSHDQRLRPSQPDFDSQQMVEWESWADSESFYRGRTAYATKTVF